MGYRVAMRVPGRPRLGGRRSDLGAEKPTLPPRGLSRPVEGADLAIGRPPQGAWSYFVKPSSLLAAITYWLVYVPARLIGCGSLPMNFSTAETVGGPFAGIIPSGRNWPLSEASSEM